MEEGTEARYHLWDHIGALRAEGFPVFGAMRGTEDGLGDIFRECSGKVAADTVAV